MGRLVCGLDWCYLNHFDNGNMDGGEIVMRIMFDVQSFFRYF